MEVSKYNLSGIYILNKYPEESKPIPTCIEDCLEETRIAWLNTLDKEGLIRCCNILSKTLRNLGEQIYA